MISTKSNNVAQKRHNVAQKRHNVAQKHHNVAQKRHNVAQKVNIPTKQDKSPNQEDNIPKKGQIRSLEKAIGHAISIRKTYGSEGDVATAVRVMRELRDSAASERVKFEAAKFIIDRADRIASREGRDTLSEMTSDQLRDLIDTTEGELGDRATLVDAQLDTPTPGYLSDIIG